MKNSAESTKQHDHNQSVRDLVRKGAELKDKSRQLKEQLDATLKQCDEWLHPEQTQNNHKGK